MIWEKEERRKRYEAEDERADNSVNRGLRSSPGLAQIQQQQDLTTQIRLGRRKRDSRKPHCSLFFNQKFEGVDGSTFHIWTIECTAEDTNVHYIILFYISNLFIFFSCLCYNFCPVSSSNNRSHRRVRFSDSTSAHTPNDSLYHQDRYGQYSYRQASGLVLNFGPFFFPDTLYHRIGIKIWTW